MALDQDLLTQIINVHWGGDAVFVFGGFEEDDGSGYIYQVKVTKEDSKPEIHKISMSRGFEPVGSSYHLVKDDDDKKGTATFLMCGNESELVKTVDTVGNPVQFTRFFTMIYISNDGLKWRKVREQAGTGDPFHSNIKSANPMGLVWNAKRKSFYYDQFESIQPTISSDQIFGSSHGQSWTAVSSTGTTPGDNTYRSAFPDTYCVDNDCLDDLGNHVPDGVMDNDNDRVTMQPEKPPISTYSNGGHSFNFSSGGQTYGSNKVRIKITEETGDGKKTTESIVSIPGVAKVMCVGGVNDIWMAGGFKGLDFDGGGAVAMSVDRGQTWKSVINTPQPILTLSAAPAEDF